MATPPGCASPPPLARQAGPSPRYQRVIYRTTPAARGVVDRAAAMLPGPLGARLSVRDLPPGVVL